MPACPGGVDDERSESHGVTAELLNFGVAGTPSGNSLCNEALYEVVAVATDATTQTSVTITHGVGVRVPTETILTYCN